MENKFTVGKRDLCLDLAPKGCYIPAKFNKRKEDADK